MKLKITCIMLALTLATVAFLGACGNKDLYVDPAGHTYIAMTDTNGNTVLNDSGNIIVYQTEEDGVIVTDESGVPQTQASIFPDVIVDGTTIQSLTYNVKLPAAWSLADGYDNMFVKALSSASVKVEIFETDAETRFNTAIEMCEAMIAATSGVPSSDTSEATQSTTAAVPEAEVEYTTSSFEYLAAGVTANTLTLTIKSSSDTTVKQFLYFENGGNSYQITCEASSQSDFDSADFAAVYSAIEYKNYVYPFN